MPRREPLAPVATTLKPKARPEKAEPTAQGGMGTRFVSWYGYTHPRTPYVHTEFQPPMGRERSGEGIRAISPPPAFSLLPRRRIPFFAIREGLPQT